MTTMTLTPAAIAEAREALTSQTKSQLAEMIGYTEKLKSIKKEALVEKALEWLTTNNPAIDETTETVETENTQEEEENVMTTETTKTATAEPKAEKKVRAKKTYEKLIMDLPSIAQLRCVCERSKKGVAIHVKLGKKRVFAYDGAVIIVNRDTLLDNVVAEKRNYGYRVAPTRENMLQLLHNAGVC